MRRIVTFALFVTAFFNLNAQQSGEVENLVRTAGVSFPEEMDPDEVERLTCFLRNPVRINLASASELESTGLFLPFQIASLIDYRKRHGHIMSFSELSAVDGFNQAKVSVLMPFISLVSRGSPGQQSDRKIPFRCDLSLKGALRNDKSYSYAVKYRMEHPAGIQFSVSTSDSYSDAALPSAATCNLTWKHSSGKIIIGDFNARFGQGLCLWNSMTMSGLSSPSSFMRVPSGLSATYSYTGSSAFKGMGADVALGKWKVTAIVAFPELLHKWKLSDKAGVLPAFNISRYGKYGQFSLTHYALFSGLLSVSQKCRIPDMKTSADVAMCIRGVNVYAESSYDWVNRKVAAVGGVDFQVSQTVRMAALMRYYPQLYKASYSGSVRAGTYASNELGAAVGTEFHAGRRIVTNGTGEFENGSSMFSGFVSADAVHFPGGKSGVDGRCVQVKAKAGSDVVASRFLVLKFRFTERFRTWGLASKTDLRADMNCLWEHFCASFRADLSCGKSVGFLSYAEGGYSSRRLALFLRQGIFIIDNWDDRIYVYERDAPGNFNVPAFYGRGLWGALVATWKFTGYGKLYFRASYTDYPLMHQEKRKPGRTELRVSFVLRI